MKRKPRNKIKKKNIDMMKPLDVTIIGSENDPCFGKHHSTTAPECGRCGDNELCSIVKLQRLNTKRLAVNGKNSFKDLEEPNMDLLTIDRFITKALKKGPKRFKDILKEGFEHFSKQEKVSKEKVDEMFSNYVKRASKFEKYMKDGKKYLKLI